MTPTSTIANIPEIMAFVEAMGPKSVLDVGAGYGKYAFLIRERLDNFQWDTRIDGIELVPRQFERSRTMGLYDHVWSCDFLDAKMLEDRYDLVLMIEFLEYLDDDHAEEAFKRALKLGKSVLVSTTLGRTPGDERLSKWPFSRFQLAADPFKVVPLPSAKETVVVVIYDDGVR